MNAGSRKSLRAKIMVNKPYLFNDVFTDCGNISVVEMYENVYQVRIYCFNHPNYVKSGEGISKAELLDLICFIKLSGDEISFAKETMPFYYKTISEREFLVYLEER